MVSIVLGIYSINAGASISFNDSDSGIHSFNDSCGSGQYSIEKSEFTSEYEIIKKNILPKEEIIKFERYISSKKCLNCTWTNGSTIQVMLQDYTVIRLTMDHRITELLSVTYDHSLMNRLSSSCVSDVICTRGGYVIVYDDVTVVDYVEVTMNCQQTKFRKLSISSIALPGKKKKYQKKHLSSNLSKDNFAVWHGQVELEPVVWSPSIDCRDRCNVSVLSLCNGKLRLLGCLATEIELHYLDISKLNSNLILTLEEIKEDGNTHNLYLNYYEINNASIYKVSTSLMDIDFIPTICELDYSETKMVMASKNNQLVCYDLNTRVINSIVIDKTIKSIKWHKSGAMLTVISIDGCLQFFDFALNLILSQIGLDSFCPSNLINLQEQTRTHMDINSIQWNAIRDDTMLICTISGPLVVLKLAPRSATLMNVSNLTKEFIKYQQYKEAVQLLRSLNWNTMEEICIQCLLLIFHSLLRLDLSKNVETDIEDTLGVFYRCSYSIQDRVILNNRDALSNLANAYFHQLVKYRSYKKALRLAIDLSCKDLFMKLHKETANCPEGDISNQSLDYALCLSDQDDLENDDLLLFDDLQENLVKNHISPISSKEPTKHVNNKDYRLYEAKMVNSRVVKAKELSSTMSSFTHSTPIRKPEVTEQVTISRTNSTISTRSQSQVKKPANPSKLNVRNSPRRNCSESKTYNSNTNSSGNKAETPSQRKPILKVHGDLSTRLVESPQVNNLSHLKEREEVEDYPDVPKAKKRLSFSNQLDCCQDNAPPRPKPILKQSTPSFNSPIQSKIFANINSKIQRKNLLNHTANSAFKNFNETYIKPEKKMQLVDKCDHV